ncbi:MAG: hypothetical protein HY842_12415 [Bacteroidetes bacterium]|nr:hypothetical protein [Bacteroidota bacterium]
MNLKTRKIIAREILLFLGLIPLLAIVWTGFEIYYLFPKSEIRELKERKAGLQSEISKVNTALEENKCYRFEELYKKLESEYDLGTLPEAKKKITLKEKREALFLIAKDDLVFSSFQDFEDFYGLPEKDYEKCELENQEYKQKISSLNKEKLEVDWQIKFTESDIDKSWRIKMMKQWGIGYVLIIYPIRGIVMVLIWSISTLKKQES